MCCILPAAKKQQGNVFQAATSCCKLEDSKHLPTIRSAKLLYLYPFFNPYYEDRTTEEYFCIMKTVAISNTVTQSPMPSVRVMLEPLILQLFGAHDYFPIYLKYIFKNLMLPAS